MGFKGERLFYIILFLIIASFTYAQDDEEIYLPDISVEAAKDTGTLINQEDMKLSNAKDLREALQYTPGITFTGGGARGDSNFTVRGFGSDSVPIYVDGIQISNPFRGEGDAARILTGDLENIIIDKGYSSSLLGANTLGGALRMRIAKPKKEVELLVDASYDFDSIFNYAGSTYIMSAGTRVEKFYAKATLQYRDIDHFRLPSSFEPTDKNPQQKGNRLWSDSIDRKITFITGVTPNDKVDIWFTYIDQNADKRLSPPDTVIRDYQIWDWPEWKRKSFSLNGTYTGSKITVEALAYYDKYDNSMIEYYNMKSFLAGIHAPPSDYDEFAAGARISVGWAINDWNTLQVAATYKKEDHKGLSGSEMQIHVNEDTWSFGAEYSITPLPYLNFVAGFGFDMLEPQSYWGKNDEFIKKLGASYYAVKTDPMRLFTWQIGAFYRFYQENELHLTYARKNHFPNMSQRYSTRFGDTLPNPSLGPEIANHVELGYKGYLFDHLNLSAAVYYSKLDGKIVNIELPNPDNPSASVDYARNLDESSFYGVELAAKFFAGTILEGGAAFSWNGYNIDKNQSGEIKVMSYYPAITANAYLKISPLDNLYFVPRAEYVSARYPDSSGLVKKLGDYCLLSIKAVWDVCDYFSITVGVSNILDTYYEIKQYSPLGGRTYSISFTTTY